MKFFVCIILIISFALSTHAQSCRSLLNNSTGGIDIAWEGVAVQFEQILENQLSYPIKSLNSKPHPYYINQSFLKTFEGSPNLMDWLNRVESLQIAGLEKFNRDNPSSSLDQSDLIRPGFSFYSRKRDQFLTLRYGDPVPEGFKLFKYGDRLRGANGMYRQQLPPYDELFPSLASGVFPILLNEEFAKHDILGHFSSYTRNFRYAAEYKKLAAYVSEYRQTNGPLTSNLAKRVWGYNELMFTIDRQQLQKNLEDFLVERTQYPRGVDSRKINFLGLYDDIMKASIKEVRELSDRLPKILRQTLKNMGGIQSENFYGKQSPMMTLGIDTYFESEIKDLPPILSKEAEQKLRIRVLTLQFSILTFSRISEVDWRLAIISEDAELFEKMFLDAMGDNGGIEWSEVFKKISPYQDFLNRAEEHLPATWQD